MIYKFTNTMLMSKSLFLIFISIIFFSCFNTQEANYNYIGKFEYEIINDSLFENTYLYESFGFLIGDLEVQGLKIDNIEMLSSDIDYILSLNHPLKNVYTKSKTIRSEGQEHLTKKPLDIIQDKSISSNHVFLYELEYKGKYRLLLP